MRRSRAGRSCDSVAQARQKQGDGLPMVAAVM
jgi:hypothetical protein